MCVCACVCVYISDRYIMRLPGPSCCIRLITFSHALHRKNSIPKRKRELTKIIIKQDNRRVPSIDWKSTQDI